jgi:hypothetical protein
MGLMYGALYWALYWALFGGNHENMRLWPCCCVRVERISNGVPVLGSVLGSVRGATMKT